DQTGYAYADGFAAADAREAARIAARIARGGSDGAPITIRVENAAAPFTLERPAPESIDENAKIRLVRRANERARGHDPRIHEAWVTFADSAKRFLVANSEGVWAEDRTDLSRLTVTALALEGDQRQSSFAAGGGCVDASYFESARTPETVA